MIRVSSGWHHFCRECSTGVMGLLGKRTATETHAPTAGLPSRDSKIHKKHKREFKTSGSTWLAHSLTAFNGTKHVDRSSPSNFVQSYYDYKTRKNDLNALVILDDHWEIAKDVANKLITKNKG